MKQISDLTFPNVGYLRDECIKRAYERPMEKVNEKEWDGIRKTVIEYVRERARSCGLNKVEDWEFDPCLQVISKDFKECTRPMPKWAAMASWLSPDGIVNKHPTLIGRIVNDALSGQLYRA